MVSGMSSSGGTCPFLINKGKEEDFKPSKDVEERFPPPPLLTSTSSTSSATSDLGVITPMQALEMAKTSCPAFQNNECPFKNVQNSTDIQNTLSAMPPSHIMVHEQGRIRSLSTSSQHSSQSTSSSAPSSPSSITRSLAAALQHVKAISQRTTATDDSSNNESCPFRSCAETMEGLSFSSLLTKMLQKAEVTATTPEIILPNLDSVSSQGKETSTPVSRSSPRKRSMSLSESLKTGTSVSHASAESVHFVKEFIKGNIDRTLYSRLILNLYFVYTSLEAELDTHGPSKFPTVHFPNELARVETLKDDVEFFYGDDYLDTLHATGKATPSPATQDYMDRLAYIAKKEPILLLSHAYTRYLGDLSGGTVLARVARKALNLQSISTECDAEEDGLRFYHFAKIPSAKLFKDNYRTALDALPNLDSNMIERLVAEANVAFVLNMRIFEELDVLACIKGAEVRPLEEAVVYYTDCVYLQDERRQSLMNGIMEAEVGDPVEEVVEAKCPFGFVGPDPHETYHHEHIPKADHEIVETIKKATGRCPWPFVFFHDPIMGMQDYQTWIVIALISCWIWNLQQGTIAAV